MGVVAVEIDAVSVAVGQITGALKSAAGAGATLAHLAVIAGGAADAEVGGIGLQIDTDGAATAQPGGTPSRLRGYIRVRSRTSAPGGSGGRMQIGHPACWWSGGRGEARSWPPPLPSLPPPPSSRCSGIARRSPRSPRQWAAEYLARLPRRLPVRRGPRSGAARRRASRRDPRCPGWNRAVSRRNTDCRGRRRAPGRGMAAHGLRYGTIHSNALAILRSYRSDGNQARFCPV